MKIYVLLNVPWEGDATVVSAHTHLHQAAIAATSHPSSRRWHERNWIRDGGTHLPTWFLGDAYERFDTMQIVEVDVERD